MELRVINVHYYKLFRCQMCYSFCNKFKAIQVDDTGVTNDLAVIIERDPINKLPFI